MRINTGGAWRTVRGGNVRVGNEWRPIVRVRAYIGGAWRDAANFASVVTLSASPLEVEGIRFGFGVVVTDAATVTPSGGLAPFTYAWTGVSGVGTPSNPTSATTTFTHAPGSGETETGVFQCQVTDSLGQTATAQVTATFINIADGV